MQNSFESDRIQGFTIDPSGSYNTGANRSDNNTISFNDFSEAKMSSLKKNPKKIKSKAKTRSKMREMKMKGNNVFKELNSGENSSLGINGGSFRQIRGSFE